MAFMSGLLNVFEAINKKKPSETIDTNNYSMELSNNPNVAGTTTADQQDVTLMDNSVKKKNNQGVSSSLGIRL